MLRDRPLIATRFLLLTALSTSEQMALAQQVPACPEPIASCALEGCWEATQSLPFAPIHAILLRTGRVLLVNSSADADDPHIGLLDPDSGAFEQLEDGPTADGGTDPHNIFCAGHVVLSNGSVLFRGGIFLPVHAAYTSIYTPDLAGGSGTWCEGPLELWNDGQNDIATWRYYPSLMNTATGVLAFDGNVLSQGQDNCPNSSTGNANMPAVYSTQGEVGICGSWTRLDDAEYFPENCPGYQTGEPHSFALGWYPFTFLLPDGSTLVAGYSDVTDARDPDPYMTRLLDPTRTMWQQVAPTAIVGQSAVFFQKRVENETRSIVLKGGGNSQSLLTESAGSDQVYAIDVTNTSNLAWVAEDPLPTNRVDHYLVALPDGKVLAINGLLFASGPSGAVAVRRPALYDPYLPEAENRWREMNACSSVARPHHSVAVLLPSGAVLSAGGDFPAEAASYEIYKPPYFFQGTRPEIAGIPASAVYGTWFNVDVSVSASSITAARLIRPGAATHSFDQEQRMLELEFTVLDSDTIRIKAPQNGNLAPPGYYLLFVATGTNGTLPSEGKFIRIRSYLSPP